MDEEAQLADEVQTLRRLCDGATPREQRLDLLQFLGQHIFLDSENQIVFESVRAIFKNGPISATRLAVHLNNRGFPDIDIERFFTDHPQITSEMK